MVANAMNTHFEVSGAYLLGLADAAEWDIQHLRADYGLDTIAVERWYPAQDVIDFYAAVGSRAGGDFDLVDIGRNIVKHINYPPHVRTITDALEMAEAMHHAGWRNGNPGELKVEHLSDAHVRMIFCDLPLPVDLVYGMCEAMVRRFVPRARNIIVERIEYGPMYIFDMRW
jgi:hypothetical protein